MKNRDQVLENKKNVQVQSVVGPAVHQRDVEGDGFWRGSGSTAPVPRL
jgi:hypothetical protein